MTVKELIKTLKNLDEEDMLKEVVYTTFDYEGNATYEQIEDVIAENNIVSII